MNMINMAGISAVILTKNEEINLKRCIDSLQWCQEIVVVDSGSTDETRQLAESLGAKIFTNVPPPPFKFSEQRNWALENCNFQGDWVLFVDADEVIPLDLSIEIQQVCANKENSYNAFELTPRYLFWGKWMKRTQGYPNWHPRLVKKGEVLFAGGMWEHFTDSAKVGKIYIPYDHFANSKGFSDWLARHDRYSTWDAENVVKFLETGKSNSLVSENKLKLRLLAARLWTLRPIGRFIYMYVLRFGFLEGIPALVCCLLYAVYEFMVVVKIVEINLTKKGLPL